MAEEDRCTGRAKNEVKIIPNFFLLERFRSAGVWTEDPEGKVQVSLTSPCLGTAGTESLYTV